MLVIRLARTGKKHQAYFRIVVADSKRAVTSKFIEILGNYNPHQKSLTIDRERLSHHLSNGAQPSNTLAKLLVKEKIELPKWVKIAEKNKNPKKEPEVKEPVSEKVENEATEAAEVPAEEAAPVSEETTEAPEEEAKEEASTESTVENAEESVNSQEKEDSASSEVEKAEKEVQEETK